jgi:hypothetical protein
LALAFDRDLDATIPFVDPDPVDRDQGGFHPEEAHLHTDVLGVVVLVHEEVVYLTDLLAVAVVDLVSRVLLLELHELVATRLGQKAHLLDRYSG